MEQPTTSTRFWTRRRRIGLAVGMLIVALGAAGGHWLPDWGLRYGLLRSLRDLGWNRVSVSAADLSLFNGAIVVRQVTAGEDLGKVLGIDGLALRFRWKPLFSRRVSVESLDLDGVDVDIHREGAGFVVNGLPLAVGGGGQSSAWSYDVTALTLTGSRIHFSDGVTAADIEVDRLEIGDLRSWEPEQPARYRLSGRLNGAPFRIEGTATPFARQPHIALRLMLERFDLAAIAPAVQQAGAGGPAGTLSADVAVDGDAGGAVNVSGTLSLGDGRWSSGSTRLSAAELGVVLDHARWDGAGVVVADGSVSSRGLRIEDGGLDIGVAAAHLAARAFRYDLGRQLLSWEGSLHADRSMLNGADTRIEHASLDWTGASRFDFAAAKGFVHAEGKAEVGGSRMAIGPLTLEAQRVVTEGVFEHALPDGMLPPLAGRMNAVAEQLWVRQPGQDVLHADRLEVTDLRLAPGSAASLARAEARTLGLLARQGKGGFRWRLEARQAAVERAALAADGGMSAATLSLDGALARVTRTQAGILGLAELAGDGTDARGPSPRVALGRLHLGGNSRVDFIDRSLPEPVRLRADAVELVMTDLDSSHPDRDAPFTAQGRIGAAWLTAQGRARPFAAVPGGDVRGTVRALDLPPLSPYVANTLGVSLQTGLLDADLSMSASQGKLDGGMQLVLKELFVAQPDPDSKLARSADMPVETVLDLLRDSDNRIQLSIPVRGDLSNPDFDISDAVGQAVGGALKTTVFTTLKVAFPLAGLISLVIDDSESRRLALEPLAFAPGADTLGDAERGRLAVVAGLMAERPTVKLTLCGVATEAADGPALAERRRLEDQGLLARLQKMVGGAGTGRGQPADRDRLAQLAEARAQAAKSFLVDHDGVDPGRLFTCRPRVEADAKAAPRVDLVL